MRIIWESSWIALVASLLSLAGVAAAQSAQPKAAGPDQQHKRGEAVFLQRCSVCHLPKEMAPYKSFGPSLVGMIGNDDPDREDYIRDFIRNGTNNMPGWKYTLSDDDLSAVIAYLKTLTKQPGPAIPRSNRASSGPEQKD